MKIALQITTSTLGDMVIEETDDKTTTNPDDQRAIVVELLVQALTKVTAAYKIPQSMLDLGDEEYEAAHVRKKHQDKEPRYSSAEANRRNLGLVDDLTGPVESHCQNPEQGCNCQLSVEDSKPESEETEDEGILISEEEMEVVRNIIMHMRGKNS